MQQIFTMNVHLLNGPLISAYSYISYHEAVGGFSLLKYSKTNHLRSLKTTAKFGSKEYGQLDGCQKRGVINIKSDKEFTWKCWM